MQTRFKTAQPYLTPGGGGGPLRGTGAGSGFRPATKGSPPLFKSGGAKRGPSRGFFDSPVPKRTVKTVPRTATSKYGLQTVKMRPYRGLGVGSVRGAARSAAIRAALQAARRGLTDPTPSKPPGETGGAGATGDWVLVPTEGPIQPAGAWTRCAQPTAQCEATRGPATAWHPWGSSQCDWLGSCPTGQGFQPGYSLTTPIPASEFAVSYAREVAPLTWDFVAAFTRPAGSDPLPQPGPPFVAVHRFERTEEVTESRMTPDPDPEFDRNPYNKYDGDNRRKRATYRIRALELAFPGDDWTPDKFPEWKITPRTGRRARTRARARSQTRSRRESRTPQKVKLARMPPPWQLERWTEHLQMPFQHEKKPDPPVPAGMMAALRVMHTGSEVQDFLESLSRALQENGYGRDPKSIHGRIGFIAANWAAFFTDGQLVKDTVKNLIANEIEDQVAARLFGARWETGVRSFRDNYSAGSWVGAAL